MAFRFDARARAWVNDVAAMLDHGPWLVLPSESDEPEVLHLGRARVDGGEMYVREPWREPGRVAFTVSWPVGFQPFDVNQGPRGSYLRLSRTVRADRSAKAVARELNVHVMKRFVVAWSEVWGKQQAAARAAGRWREAVAEIEARGGRALGEDRAVMGGAVFYWRGGETVEVRGQTTVGRVVELAGSPAWGELLPGIQLCTDHRP